MLTRRSFLSGTAAAAAATFVLPRSAEAAWELPDPYRAQIVPVRDDFGLRPGEIHVVQSEFFLYLILPGNRALRYGVAVGDDGRRFKGSAVIQRKAQWPSWTPTSNMIRREPERYAQYKAGMPGGPDNPLGARALYLYRNGRDTMYRIHGTPQPWSIGQAVSSGCIRMLNEHVADLYMRVPVGTRVTTYA
ncbi:L,D-transpeptidase [Aestuariibius insulae]|uniref:L,D-transpeptidase n=1 Tax=Aestuariibius insulae TaxID=2058287 RepID=UPI00345EAF43